MHGSRTSPAYRRASRWFKSATRDACLGSEADASVKGQYHARLPCRGWRSRPPAGTLRRRRRRTAADAADTTGGRLTRPRREPPPPGQQPAKVDDGSRERVGHDRQEQDGLRRGDGQHDEHDEPEEHLEGMAMVELDLLEREVPDLAHHEARDRVDYEQHEDALVRRTGAAEVVEEQHGGRDHVGRGRDREADEVPLLDRPDLHVEAREPERAARHVERRRKPAPAPPGHERPLVDEDPGRDAERHQIGERIVLLPERARRAGEPCDAPVQHVARLGDEDHDGGELVAMTERRDHGVETGDQAGGREEVRQEVDAAAERRNATPAPPRNDADASTVAHAGSSAMTVVPACTRSPRATSGRTSAGRNRSTRDPYMMRPKRTPRRVRSPGATLQTIRRATAPAICTIR